MRAMVKRWRIQDINDEKAQKLKRDLGLKSNDDLVAVLLDSQNVETLRKQKDKINELHADKREDERLKKAYREKQTELLEKNTNLELKVEQLNAQLKDMEKLRYALESSQKEKSDLEEKVEHLSSNEIIGKYADLESKFVELEKQRKNVMNKCDLLEEQIDAMKEPKKLYDENVALKKTLSKHTDFETRAYEQYKKLASENWKIKQQNHKLHEILFRRRKSRGKKQ